MVHPGMVGITELMTDDRFVGWMEEQPDNLLETVSTYELYTRYQEFLETVSTYELYTRYQEFLETGK